MTSCSWTTSLSKQLRTTLEPIGLIPGTNIYRPADLLPAPFLNDVKALGLDVCVTTAVSEQAARQKDLSSCTSHVIPVSDGKILGDAR